MTVYTRRMMRDYLLAMAVLIGAAALVAVVEAVTR